MENIFQMATSVATPLALAGFIVAGLFYVLRQILAKKIFPRLTVTLGANFLEKVVDRLFFLSITAIILGSVAYVASLFASVPHMPTSEEKNIVAKTPVPPLSLEMLKNMTYVIEGERLTLQDGKLEFTFNDDDSTHFDTNFTYAYLTGWAFGDIANDGNIGAAAIIQQTDGGSGIFYYLVPVLNENGHPKPLQEGFLIGDRLQFKSIDVYEGRIELNVLMHRDSDALCCPTELRKLRFTITSGKMTCDKKPCSEFS